MKYRRPSGPNARSFGPYKLVAVDVGEQQLDRPVRADPLDAGHGAGVAAARDVAALGDVDGAVRPSTVPQGEPPVLANVEISPSW